MPKVTFDFFISITSIKTKDQPLTIRWYKNKNKKINKSRNWLSKLLHKIKNLLPMNLSHKILFVLLLDESLKKN